MPTVSVIIPAFNAVRTLQTCIEGVNRQTFRDYEIIVVDDGSSDGTAALAASLGNVRLIRQHNTGPAVARNTGIEAAQGEWLAFLDADDEWIDDSKLARQLECAERYAAVLIGASGRPGIERTVSLSSLLLKNCFYTSSVIVKREAAQKAGMFEPGSFFSEDYLLWLTIVASGGKAALADTLIHQDIEGRARYDRGGLSGNLASMQRGELHDFYVLFRKRLLSRTIVGNALIYLLVSLFSTLKYFRRIIFRTLRTLSEIQ